MPYGRKPISGILTVEWVKGNSPLAETDLSSIYCDGKIICLGITARAVPIVIGRDIPHGFHTAFCRTK